jgi:hypothetical protein
VQHIILPQATDPDIDTFLDPHYVWLDPPRMRRPMLWVFLPSTGTKPADFQLIANEVASLGYHVINLMYPNRDAVVDVCNRLADPDQRESCYLNFRLQTLDGRPRSNFTKVNPRNSIYNRLAKLLQYLGTNFPEEGWEHFLNDGAPRWSRITVAGHSQGGGTAALIGTLHRVARVVMISSPVDGSVDPPSQAAHWVTIGATPATRYYGLAHQREIRLGGIRANWKALGLDAFGGAAAPETSTRPYGCSHMLVTGLPTPAGRYHRSTAEDADVPLLADGTPALREAWRYISAHSHDSSRCETGSDDDRRLSRR